MKRNEIINRLNKYTLTDFQRKVLLATMKIKRGQIKTYRDIAIQIRHKNAYRAVGTALKNNPLPIIIPCHRVVRSDGDIGGYSGHGGRARKLTLLKIEGAMIRG